MGIKMSFEYTYSLRFEGSPTVVLNPDTYCPMKSAVIRLNISYEAQHDGKSWSDEFVKEQTDELIDTIMADMRDKVAEYVREVNPFLCHQFK
jgi:hypothetical protein